MGKNSILSARMHSIKYLRLYFTLLSLITVIGKGETFNNDTNIVLVLESYGQDQDPDLNKYRCTTRTSQIQVSKIIHGCVEQEYEMDSSAQSSDIEGSLPRDENEEFFESGFNDMCNYIQNNIFNQDYNEKTSQLPIPLLLDNQKHFYNLKQLTQYEISFMKQVESFDIARMNNLFKLADFLQIERFIITIIAARQASLMINLKKGKMIDWLMDNQNEKEHMLADNKCNSNNYDRHVQDNNEDNLKMAPLLFIQTQSYIDDNDNKQECTINEIIKVSFRIIATYILQFFSCYDIHTFSSISNDFYQFLNQLNVLIKSI